MVVEALDALVYLAMDPGDQQRVALVGDQGFRKHLEAVDVFQHRRSSRFCDPARRPCAVPQLINTCEGALETLVG
ncbi:hypothetical protein D3C72_1918750 [compost metagenome]